MTIDEAIQELESRKAFLQQSCAECWPEEMEMALQALKSYKTGKWIPKMMRICGIDWPSGMKCSCCGEDALNSEGIEFLTDYCPNCGARMVEDE